MTCSLIKFNAGSSKLVLSFSSKGKRTHYQNIKDDYLEVFIPVGSTTIVPALWCWISLTLTPTCWPWCTLTLVLPLSGCRVTTVYTRMMFVGCPRAFLLVPWRSSKVFLRCCTLALCSICTTRFLWVKLHCILSLASGGPWSGFVRSILFRLTVGIRVWIFGRFLRSVSQSISGFRVFGFLVFLIEKRKEKENTFN